MSLLQETLKKIQKPDTAPGELLVAKMEALGERGLWGKIEPLMTTYANATGHYPPPMPEKYTIIACADHGVAQMQVSAYPPETTLHMTTNYLISHGGAANAFANFASSQLLVVDMGINGDTSDLPGLIQAKIAYGTKNSACGPAMSIEEAITSIETGILLAEKCCQQGATILLPGEMGIANTTASAAITAALCQAPVEKTTGRGTNISDQRLKTKISIVKQILEVNKPNIADPIDVLAKVGGFELGCIAGIILGAAANHALTILDGFNTGAAALIATALSEETKYYIAPSHIGGEAGHPIILNKLGLKPMMNIRLCLGEAIASSLTADILDMSLHALESMTSHKYLQEAPEKLFSIKHMAKNYTPITDKTFNFYTSTMPPLYKEAMDKCSLYIDNLAKPIYSLGHIEKIALEMAGIFDEEIPSMEQKKELICFMEGNQLSQSDKSLMAEMATQANATVSLGLLKAARTISDAFEFGRLIGEKTSLSSGLIGISLCSSQLSQELYQALCHPDNSLKWQPKEFLGKLSPQGQLFASAILGCILAASHNQSLIILDDLAITAIARYCIALCPETEPYILSLEPDIYMLSNKISRGFNACLGFRLAESALHMLNDMSSFATARVATANDGPGALRQN